MHVVQPIQVTGILQVIILRLEGIKFAIKHILTISRGITREVINKKKGANCTFFLLEIFYEIKVLQIN
jgi:hypothetical protein